MAENDCLNPEKHCDLHACQLTFKEMKPEIDKIYNDPKYACTNCGARVHDSENLCRPKAL